MTQDLIDTLGIKSFRRPKLLEVALTHRSWSYENGATPHNERMELLGDAVLGLVIADLLYRRFPKAPEGDLAKLRASLVSASALASVARDINIGDFVKLGRGEEMTEGRQKTSVLSDTFEAVIGAVYLDRGITATRKCIEKLFDSRLAQVGTDGAPRDSKTTLQELLARNNGLLPVYKVEGHGPDHDRRFKAVVYADSRKLGSGEGRSKKHAEQVAALVALEKLESAPNSLKAPKMKASSAAQG